MASFPYVTTTCADDSNNATCGEKFATCPTSPAPLAICRVHYNIAPHRQRRGRENCRERRYRACVGTLGSHSVVVEKPLKQLPASFNARAESVVDKPMFRDVFQRHRCIIPASSYYEWIVSPDGKPPYYISTADGGALSFAGL